MKQVKIAFGNFAEGLTNGEYLMNRMIGKVVLCATFFGLASTGCVHSDVEKQAFEEAQLRDRERTLHSGTLSFFGLPAWGENTEFSGVRLIILPAFRTGVAIQLTSFSDPDDASDVPANLRVVLMQPRDDVLFSRSDSKSQTYVRVANRTLQDHSKFYEDETAIVSVDRLLRSLVGDEFQQFVDTADDGRRGLDGVSYWVEARVDGKAIFVQRSSFNADFAEGLELMAPLFEHVADELPWLDSLIASYKSGKFGGANAPIPFLKQEDFPD